MKNINKIPVQSKTAPLNRTAEHHRQYIPVNSTESDGLAGLQQTTSNILAQAPQWGFNKSKLNVRRHKLNKHIWQLTVTNPKTRKTILQAEGHGDTVFANEDNLARMAEILMAQGLTIRTQFDD
ncbi:hypothetical protein MNBD_GAMMA09-893 [hydrothermal vent metagenome]|uniref:Uncharacterized protein n=1 Tax=hydrothermal vent metagenome TaxID=652676 RepID=A0A3B0XCB1_9ZZZZ